MGVDAKPENGAVTQARVAIIGAGMSGLACAAALRGAGFPADVFDKGRFPGGRVGTRVEKDLSWDHGAQFFRAHDASFRHELEQWVARGVAGAWPAASDGRKASYMGLPSMRAFAAHLAEGLHVQCGVTVSAVERQAGGFHVRGRRRGSEDEVLGEYERIVCSAPAPQAIGLFPELAEPLSPLTYLPCWALMLAYPQRLDLASVLRGEGDILGFAQREADKPSRPQGSERWLVHMSPEWSAQHLEATPERVLSEAFAAFSRSPYRALTEPAVATAHRWRYARVEHALGEPFLLSEGLGVCGDGMLGSRVEWAFESGRALGVELAASLR